ncbi:MAG: hypothetical protein GXO42_02675 [bacterium]|nr:hypothetical protein [bacterium]
MLGELLISLYFLASSWIYGYYVIRRAFWVVRLVEPKHRIKIAFLFGMPLVIPFVFLMWFFSPLYLSLCFVLGMLMYSYYIQTHPRPLMHLLLRYVGLQEIVAHEPTREQVKTMVLKQRLLRSIELQQDLIDRITEEIKIMRQMVKSAEKPLIRQVDNSKLQLSSEDMQEIKAKISELRKKYSA